MVILNQKNKAKQTHRGEMLSICDIYTVQYKTHWGMLVIRIFHESAFLFT